MTAAPFTPAEKRACIEREMGLSRPGHEERRP